jgi:predicted RNase H-like nuclease
MKFLGIDLGWSSGASGLCCLDWQQDKLEVLSLEQRLDLTDILDWIDGWLPPGTPGMIAVDAPTVIPNLTGMRLCDRLAHRYFGRYHAGCYPANQGLGFAARTVEFGQLLNWRGFTHAPVLAAQQPGRYQIEVFPHAAMIYLFQLEQIIKYKKGRLCDRQTGLKQLGECMLTYLPVLEPAVSNLELAEIPTTGIALKALEDCWDALICAYVGAHWWYWGSDRNWVLGGIDPLTVGEQQPLDPTKVGIPAFLATGYIVVPRHQP